MADSDITERGATRADERGLEPPLATDAGLGELVDPALAGTWHHAARSDAAPRGPVVRWGSSMPDRARRVGSALAAVAVVWGAFAWGRQHLRALREEAEGVARVATREALERAAAVVAAAPAEAAEHAVNLAALEGMKKLMPAADTDDREVLDAWVSTLQGNLEEEDWTRPWRELGTLAFALGGKVVYAAGNRPALEALVAPYLDAAEATGRASGLGLLEGRVVVVGLGRVAQRSPRQEWGVVVLASPLRRWLEAIAQRAGAPVALLEAGVTTSRGAPQAVAQLEAAGRVPGALDDPCCAFLALAGEAKLGVWADAGPLVARAAATGRRDLLMAVGAGLLVGAAVLLVGFRRRERRGPRTRPLAETSAELVGSRDELQQRSRRLGGPLRTATPPPLLAASEPAVRTPVPTVPSRYVELMRLGEGGMATVSVAQVTGAEGFRRLFVVKRLRPELAGHPDMVSQFIDEASLGASLVHSNIIPVFDFGRDDEGYYLAQEYILGRDVDALLQTSKVRRGRPLEAPVVLYLAQEALKALSYAHGKRDEAGRSLGLVHRDVSPNNLLVSARGEVKLLDFGIVKSEGRLTRTQSGVVKGNLYFMSPEQARAWPVDARSDLFSLGMVLLTAAFGAPLYRGRTSFELLARAGNGPTEEDLRKVAGLGAPLAELIARAIAVDPKDRFQDAEDFARAVAAAGPAATSGQLQALMEELFRDELDAESSRLSRSGV